MKKLLLLICIPFIGIAQTDYELAFNSASLDYVEIPNASSQIANSIAFSMSGWVYPQANTTAHSGIMGFRNNTDADFYLLQLQNSNNVEARFRNSTGTSFDVLAINLLDFNQWQHLAFTYDGSNIYLYKNGVLISSTPANGIITQTSQSFKIGTLDWNGTGFYMNGSLDEIRLWNITLSQNTISNWMCNEITTSHPNYNSLTGYWRLNDGVGTTTTDLSLNGNNGTLMGAVQWQVTTSCFGSPLLTYVPDDNFENYLEANGMGDGIALNDYVFTTAIDTVEFVGVPASNIADLTGIEDFTSLTGLMCDVNQLTYLDLSQNTNLTYLECWSNQLTFLDVSQSINLTILSCESNQLTSLDVSNNANLESLMCFSNQIISLDVSQNIALTFLSCWDNQLSSLDVSQNINLENLGVENNQLSSLDVSQNSELIYLACGYNQLTFLDLRNGNNMNITSPSPNGTGFWSVNNPELTCINVDDSLWSSNNWSVANLSIDPQQYFNNDCSGTTDIEEHKIKKNLLKIIDLLGRESKQTYKPLLYIYDNGSVEKQIIIE